jgi:hypothetical protein
VIGARVVFGILAPAGGAGYLIRSETPLRARRPSPDDETTHRVRLMPRAGPAAAFANAREAMERADWEAFFGCLDRSDLLRLAMAGIPLGDETSDPLYALCIESGVPAPAH